ncbi:pyruvate formate lyase family protein [Deltaproteobacteria bacterium TL4]
MLSSTINPELAYDADRIMRLKHAVQTEPLAICTERAHLWTQYFKKFKPQRKPASIQIAEALKQVLKKKTIHIHPDEWIVGNYTSKRVGGSIYPELHGITALEDLFKFSHRQTNPLKISPLESLKLLKIIPFWSTRFLLAKAYKNPLKTARLISEQLQAHYYLINESAGISHIAPNYEKLLKMGTDGYLAEVNTYQKKVKKRSPAWNFYEGVKIIAEGLAQFGERYADESLNLAKKEQNPQRKQELERIAHVCKTVPRKRATSFHEALQSLFFAQIAINLESLDNSVCPGRMDQYLFPYYAEDLQTGRITRAKAKELVAAFSIKMSEIIPVFSERITKVHGGMFNGQVVVVGGLKPDGTDGVNELTYIFLEVMDELRMRQPNYHARIHADSPSKYVKHLNTILSNGGNSPALYNDDQIVPTLIQNGYTAEDARNYTGIGCVEPVSQGKSFASTDAALVNVPIILELALNEGKPFGKQIRSGAKTQPVSKMKSMEDVKLAFETQLQYQFQKLHKDLNAIEIANKTLHPTPLSSMLLDGCIESGKCSTAGGAQYNFSGVQCVAPTNTGDALYAIEKAVFVDQQLSLTQLVSHLKNNFSETHWLTYFRNLDKFGNDQAEVDQWTLYVINTFHQRITRYENTRGGKYTMGIYSVTCHQHFGEITGTLPDGRRKGEAFAAGLSPSNGMDQKGPTALLNSVNRIDFSKTANGVNFNVKFDSHTLRGQGGPSILGSLIKTYFRRGGMQMQVNVLDPQVLIDARDNPDLYPYLLVRVSGYSAYFNDLTPAMKEELIRRSNLKVA